MKGKKFAALILAVVMALTMLTACGGGGGSTSGDLDLAAVNEILEGAGSGVTVTKDNNLTTGVIAAAQGVAQGTVTGPASAVNTISKSLITSYRIVSAYATKETDVLAGSISISGTQAIGVLNTPEKIVAGKVMEKEATYGSGCVYSASAKRCVAPDGTVVWVIAVLVK